VETSRLGERAALQGAIAVALHAARTGSETVRRRPGPPSVLGRPPRADPIATKEKR
jgi:hypothetical protein